MPEFEWFYIQKWYFWTLLTPAVTRILRKSIISIVSKMHSAGDTLRICLYFWLFDVFISSIAAPESPKNVLFCYDFTSFAWMRPFSLTWFIWFLCNLLARREWNHENRHKRWLFLKPQNTSVGMLKV